LGCSFFESFFSSRQLIKIQKKNLKNEHPYKSQSLFNFARALEFSEKKVATVNFQSRPAECTINEADGANF
jgi:hypothetical protein